MQAAALFVGRALGCVQPCVIPWPLCNTNHVNIHLVKAPAPAYALDVNGYIDRLAATASLGSGDGSKKKGHPA